MRSIAALAVLLVAGLLASEVASGSGAKARLTIVDRSPVVVHGASFHAGEAVRVRTIVRGGPRLAKSVVAGSNGVFRARFVSLSVGRCKLVTVQATGARGSRASYTSYPLCGAAP